MRLPDSSLLLFEGEQFLDLNFEHFGKLLQPGDGWRVNATFHEADELNRAADSFGELLLCELLCPAQVGNAFAQFSLKHAVLLPFQTIPHHQAKLRVAFPVIGTFQRETKGGMVLVSRLCVAVRRM